MFEHRDQSSKYRTYLVAADEFELVEGDKLQPGSEIGMDINSGTPIYADYWGHIASVYYNPMSQSLLVMVYRENHKKGRLHLESKNLVAFSLAD